jgi:hypothetical protein
VRRACFRPGQISTLPADLTALEGHIVTVRLERLGKADTPYRGQRLYRILDARRSVRESLRPESEFDFLD